MDRDNNFREAEKKARNKTKIYLITGLATWMTGLFFFLNQSKYEQSLVFAKILPTGLDLKKIVVIDDTSKIDPNIDPKILVVDTTDIDTSLKKGVAYSLKTYAPAVLSQGQLGSCVSWASAYAGFTIVKRLEKNNKNLEPFSPLNLYVRYKKQFDESPCSYGACIPFALNILKSNGCSVFNKFLPNECTKDVSENIIYEDKLYSYDPINPSSINSIKSAISANMPVVIGIKSYDGDDWKNAVLDEGVWNGHYSGTATSGHAMCLVGYDDNKDDGAFEIMNSWGEDWGEKGYIWIRYNDFIKHVDQSYALIPGRTK